MNDLKNGKAHEESEAGPGPWLSDILSKLRISPKFGERCEQAALLAYSIEKLRRERERRGFFAIPIRSYLDRLARYAEVKLEAVLEWADLADLQPTLERAPNLGGLLRSIGFSLGEACALIRVSFGEERGCLFLPARIVYRGEGFENNELQRTELALDEMEGAYSPDVKENLSGILTLVTSEFEDG